MIKLVATLVIGLIKHCVATSSISVSELLYDNSITKCTLSGNTCTPLCERVTTKCQYRSVDRRFMTLGMLYFFMKLGQNKALDDKNFLFQILTKKSLYDIIEFEPYDPLDDLKTELAKLKSKNSVATTKLEKKSTIVNVEEVREDLSENHRIIIEMIRRLEVPVIENARIAYKKFEDSGITIPAYIIKMKNEAEKLQNPKPNEYSFTRYLNLLKKYIFGRLELPLLEVEAIIKWIVLDFIPRDKADFPIGTCTFNNPASLIEHSKSLPADHPYKWTSKRVDIINSTSDYYEKMIYFDSLLYAWKLFIIGDLREVSRWEIRYKYLLDHVILQSCYLYNSTFIVLKNDAINISSVFNAFTSISPIRGFLFDKQKNNFFRTKSDIDLDTIKSELRTSNVNLSVEDTKIYEYLLKNNLLEDAKHIIS